LKHRGAGRCTRPLVRTVPITGSYDAYDGELITDIAAGLNSAIGAAGLSGLTMSVKDDKNAGGGDGLLCVRDSERARHPHGESDA
jgi:hypothetical protein